MADELFSRISGDPEQSPVSNYRRLSNSSIVLCSHGASPKPIDVQEGDAERRLLQAAIWNGSRVLRDSVPEKVQKHYNFRSNNMTLNS